MKRLFDTVLVLLSAPLWLPAAAVVSLLVLVFDGAPVFFRQERAGKGGKTFRMLKFRTMKDAPGSDSERMTRLGKFLRKTALDELPQLFHVLSGKMSLVGPRPLPARYLPRYSAFQARRHEVRPGITGFAQVNGRNGLLWEEKFALDVWYVEHASFLLDLKILFATAAKVAMRKGIDAPGGGDVEEFGI